MISIQLIKSERESKHIFFYSSVLTFKNLSSSAFRYHTRRQQFFASARTSPAASLGPTERKRLSLQVLAKTQPFTRLAQDYRVSRKFLYQQADKATRL